eukprot:g3789.t1
MAEAKAQASPPPHAGRAEDTYEHKDNAHEAKRGSVQKGEPSPRAVDGADDETTSLAGPAEAKQDDGAKSTGRPPAQAHEKPPTPSTEQGPRSPATPELAFAQQGETEAKARRLTDLPVIDLVRQQEAELDAVVQAATRPEDAAATRRPGRTEVKVRRLTELPFVELVQRQEAELQKEFRAAIQAAEPKSTEGAAARGADPGAADVIDAGGTGGAASGHARDDTDTAKVAAAQPASRHAVWVFEVEFAAHEATAADGGAGARYAAKLAAKEADGQTVGAAAAAAVHAAVSEPEPPRIVDVDSVHVEFVSPLHATPPPTWTRQWDAHGTPYVVHNATGESVWEADLPASERASVGGDSAVDSHCTPRPMHMHTTTEYLHGTGTPHPTSTTPPATPATHTPAPVLQLDGYFELHPDDFHARWMALAVAAHFSCRVSTVPAVATLKAHLAANRFWAVAHGVVQQQMKCFVYARQVHDSSLLLAEFVFDSAEHTMSATLKWEGPHVETVDGFVRLLRLQHVTGAVSVLREARFDAQLGR